MIEEIPIKIEIIQKKWKIEMKSVYLRILLSDIIEKGTWNDKVIYERFMDLGYGSSSNE